MNPAADIANIQAILAVPVSGTVDEATDNALQELRSESKINQIQAVLQPYTQEQLSPGVVGPRMMHALDRLSDQLSKNP